MTVASLGISVDSSAAKAASIDLDKLVSAAQQAERAQTGLAQGNRQAESSIRATTAAVRQLTEAESRMGSVQAGRRAQDIAAYGAELDRLRAKFNPVFAVSKAYEQSLDELNMAHRVGAITAQEQAAALDMLNARYAGTATAAQVATGAMVAAAGASGLAAHNARNLNFQLIDIAQGIPMAFYSPIFALQNLGFQMAQIGQIYMGQGGMRQALRDITGMAASAGTAIAGLAAAHPALAAGIGVAVAAGGALAVMFANSEEDARSFAERLDDLGSSIDSYRASSRLAVSGTEGMIEAYGTASLAVRELVAALRDLDRDNAMRDARATVQGLAADYMDLGQATQFMMGMLLPIEGLNKGVEALTDNFGMSRDAAEELQAAIIEAQAAKTIEEQAEALRGVAHLLEEQKALQGELPSEAQALYEEIRRSEDMLRRLLGVSDNLPGSFNAAADSAAGLAAEIERASRAAAGMAASSALGLKRAQIELQYVDDPAGKAAALAATDFNAQVGDTSNLPDGLRRNLQERRATIEAEARATVEVNEKIAAIEKAQREAARSSRRSGGGGGVDKAAREAERLAEAYDDLVQGAQRFVAEQEMETRALGMTAEAAARFRNEQEMLNQAQDKGISLSAAQRGEIAALAGAMAEAEARLATATLMDDASSAAAEFMAAQEMERQALRMTEEEARRLRIEFDFLNEARRDGIELTAEQQARLGELAGAMAASEEATRSQAQAMQDAETAVQAVGDAIRGVIDGTTTWQDALVSVIETLLEMETVQKRIAELFGSGGQGASGGGGGFFGSILGSIFGGGGGGFGGTSGAIAGLPTTSTPGVTMAPGFSSGGWTGGRRGRPAGIVHGEEFVVQAGPAQQFRPALEAMNRGAAPQGGASSPVTIEGSTIVLQGAQANPQEFKRIMDDRDRRLMERVQGLWTRNPSAFPGSI